MCQRLYDLDAKAAARARCSPPRCRRSRRTSSATRSSCARGSSSTTARRSTRRRSSPSVQRFIDLPRLDRARATSRPSTASPRPGRTPSSIHLKARDSTFTGGNPYVLSPTQLAKLGDNFATEPGLRRPVHVRPPRRRRPRHRDQVALLLRPEERLPRQDRLQADARRGGRGGGAEGGRHPGARPGLDDGARRPSGRPRACG